MNLSIDLNYQFKYWAIEIYNKPSYSVLASEPMS